MFYQLFSCSQYKEELCALGVALVGVFLLSMPRERDPLINVEIQEYVCYEQVHSNTGEGGEERERGRQRQTVTEQRMKQKITFMGCYCGEK